VNVSVDSRRPLAASGDRQLPGNEIAEFSITLSYLVNKSPSFS
jgi:hypothetical protein